MFEHRNEHHLTSLVKRPNMGVSKNRGKTPKMDGENNGQPY